MSTPVGRQVAAIRRTPAQAQRDFRTLLDVLARPGSIGTLLPPPEGPPAVIPVIGLADLEVPLAIVADEADAVWVRAVEIATQSPIVPLAEARMVLALRPLTTRELTALDRGDPLRPERGTRLVQSVNGLGVPSRQGGVNLRLTGPGVPGERRLTVRGLPPEFFSTLSSVNADFPAGVDTFLVAGNGLVAGIPRSVDLDVSGAD
jgi:alpha-D-ribose 1-methylphosphonate 5-triphosphate synthase subunit PhnH